MLEKNDPRLTAFVLGELDESERREIETEIAASAELALAVAELRSVCAEVQSVFDEELAIQQSSPISTLATKQTEPATKISNWVFWSAACSIAILAISVAFVLSSTADKPVAALSNSTEGWTFNTPAGESNEEASVSLGSSSIPNEGVSTEILRANIGDFGSEIKDVRVPNLSMIVSSEDDRESLLADSDTQNEFLSGGEIPIDIAVANANSNSNRRQDFLETLSESQKEFEGSPDYLVPLAFGDADQWQNKIQKRTKFQSEMLQGNDDVDVVATEGENFKKAEAFWERLRDIDEVANIAEHAKNDWRDIGVPKFAEHEPSVAALQDRRAAEVGPDDPFNAPDPFGEEDEAPKQIEEATLSQLQGGRQKSERSSVDTFTFDGQVQTQRASDEELVRDLLKTESMSNSNADRVFRRLQLADLQSQLKTARAERDAKESSTQRAVDDSLEGSAIAQNLAGEPDIVRFLKELEKNPDGVSSDDLLRAGFDINGQVERSEVQLQTALQRLGEEHPAVRSARAQLAMLRKFEDRPARISKTAEDLVPSLLRRIDPSGIQEIDVNGILLDPKLAEGELTDLFGSVLDVTQREQDVKAMTNAVIFLESIEDKTEQNQVRSKLVGELNNKLREYAKAHNRKIRGWRKVKATGNSSRLIVGDRDELDLTGMQVHVQVDGFRARVLIDYFYYNDRDRQLEGNFKMRLPDDASLYYFAFGQSAYKFSPNGPMAGGEFVDGRDQYVSLGPTEIGLARQDAWKNVKEARMVPREKAAFAYSQTVRRRVDPALVEWSGAGIFNARVLSIYPQKIAPHRDGLRR